MFACAALRPTAVKSVPEVLYRAARYPIAVTVPVVLVVAAPKPTAVELLPVFDLSVSFPTATFDAVTSLVDANSWVSGIWSLPTEEAYEGRQGVLVTP